MGIGDLEAGRSKGSAKLVVTFISAQSIACFSYQGALHSVCQYTLSIFLKTWVPRCPREAVTLHDQYRAKTSDDAPGGEHCSTCIYMHNRAEQCRESSLGHTRPAAESIIVTLSYSRVLVGLSLHLRLRILDSCN